MSILLPSFFDGDKTMKSIKILIVCISTALTLQASNKQPMQQPATKKMAIAKVEESIKNKLTSLQQGNFDQAMIQFLGELPYDILGLEQWSDVIRSGTSFVFSPFIKEIVSWRLSVFIKFIPEIRKLLEDYDTNMALLYGFIATYPTIAALPRVQKLFELAFNPEFASWRSFIFETQIDGFKFIEERLKTMQQALTTNNMNLFAQELASVSQTLIDMWSIFIDHTRTVQERSLRKARKAQQEPEPTQEQTAIEAEYTKEVIKTVKEALKNLDWNFPEFVKMRADMEKIFSGFMLQNIPLSAGIKK